LARKNTISKKIELLDAQEEDDNGFIEGDVKVGKIFASFNFAPQTGEPTAASIQVAPALTSPVASPATPAPAKSFMFNTASPKSDGLVANTNTPPVDCEAHTVNRFYKIRYSTAKMLNEIKASHPDVNVYMNSIVDEAIRHYYSFVFKK
jgi:hypothetical protein